MSIRYMVVFTVEEADALNQLAQSEMRSPRDQIRLMIRNELEAIGQLKAIDSQSERENDHQIESPSG